MIRSRDRDYGASNTGSLQSVISSTVFDLDATKSASYSGSGQSWQNICVTPADGVAQSAYNQYLGVDGSVSTDDPTLSGSAGTAGAYFAMDGGDVLRLQGAHTAFLEGLHRTSGGGDWWMAMAFRFVAGSGATQYLMATRTSASAIGMSCATNGTDQIQFGIRGDSANVTTSATAFAPLTATDYVFIGTFSLGGNLRRMWLNSRTKSEAAFTRNACTSSASGVLTIGGSAGGSPASFLASGTRLYAFAMGNAFIDDADAAKIFDAYNARHGRTYA